MRRKKRKTIPHRTTIESLFSFGGKCNVAKVYCLTNTCILYTYSQSIYRFTASMPHCISFNTNAKHVVNSILWNEKPKRNMKACWWRSWHKKSSHGDRIFFFCLSSEEILKLLCTLSSILRKSNAYSKKTQERKNERDWQDGERDCKTMRTKQINIQINKCVSNDCVWCTEACANT